MRCLNFPAWNFRHIHFLNNHDTLAQKCICICALKNTSIYWKQSQRYPFIHSDKNQSSDGYSSAEIFRSSLHSEVPLLNISEWTDVMDRETGSLKFMEPVLVHFLFLFCLFCYLSKSTISSEIFLHVHSNFYCLE